MNANVDRKDCMIESSYVPFQNNCRQKAEGYWSARPECGLDAKGFAHRASEEQ